MLLNGVQAPQETTLTSFFKLCTQDNFARNLLYNQIPSTTHGTAGTRVGIAVNKGQIVPEKTGIRSTDALGRVYTVHPNNSECFHLRLLLHEVRGPTSFTDLRTVQGRVCNTFKEACQLQGLLENDEHWNTALEEAAASRSPKMMRNLFAVMLQTCSMSGPEQLWMNHRENLSEDILHQARI
ncbi:uncharacterized protein LOC118196414 [Stegodyphus dumicola]|uniref:uncharacterized protein LOC118196414 n=1 Tax=Stegodyphus dumicola TaxID=202533 RepID=UPI0015ACF841|nr:uncharacterized protein LOC118196414 [Stegodyphus dumicola]